MWYPKLQTANRKRKLFATGSEVQLAVAAQKALAEEGIQVRVISMPSLDLFEKQPKAYKDSVLLPEC